MDKAKQKFFNDYLEVITFFVFILILLVIYIPSLIWEEEDMYKEESRFRMQTVYNVENFHNILTGSYETDGKKAVTLVNAVRDSVMADSTFLGEQIVKLNGEEFLVDVPKGFDVELAKMHEWLRFLRKQLNFLHNIKCFMKTFEFLTFSLAIS